MGLGVGHLDKKKKKKKKKKMVENLPGASEC